MRAQVNPNFWADTSYKLEYGLAPCPAGCTETGEQELGAGIVRKGIQTDPIELTGLEPGTTYHYRVRNRDESGNLGVSDDYTVHFLQHHVLTPSPDGPRGSLRARPSAQCPRRRRSAGG